MIRTSFNDGWTAGPKLSLWEKFSGRSPEAAQATLPYDVVRDMPRSPDSPQGTPTAYFPGGHFEYSKSFDVPEEYRSKKVTFEFEGVYRDAMVYINGDFVAQRPNGYANFYVKADPYLLYGERNTIRVESRMHEDTRWYTGAGIYRNTKIIVTEPVHVALDGIRVTTPDVDSERAVAVISTAVENEGLQTRTVRVTTRIVAAADGEIVATGSVPVTVLPGTAGTAQTRLYVTSPKLWSVENPDLYRARTVITEGNQVLDEEQTVFGIRTLRLNPVHGLRINGETVKLRGACIHHDTGLLGSAAIARAEERRVEILREAGFNAIRSAHNAISKATLDACDRIGMLVMDETFDMWTDPKSSFDYALAFPEWWERDVEAMIAKDFNHPSVVFYSIGNEIIETGRPVGSTWGRRLADKIRLLDGTRFVTNAVNGLFAVLDELATRAAEAAEAGIDDLMALVNASEEVTARTEESFSVLDVAGMNYSDSRYLMDRELFPDRIIVGTENFPGHIDVLWKLVQENGHVIGDFTWTGWDYLGEVGVGRIDYPNGGQVKVDVTAYPWLTAWTGDIDITGHRRPVSYYRETVYGLRRAPYIAVHRPQFHGRPVRMSPWAWTDSVSSWSWDVPAGSPATIDVYSDADEVELHLNGRSIGRSRVGGEKAFVARFEASYEPGELVAVAYAAGEEQARTVLRTAEGLLHLAVASDREVITADDNDLAYVTITLQDAQGNLASDRDRLVRVQVGGTGVLAGLGSGRPRTTERFDASECTTFDGRALAVVRPTGPGLIEIQVSADECNPVTVSVSAVGHTGDFVLEPHRGNPTPRINRAPASRTAGPK